MLRRRRWGRILICDPYRIRLILYHFCYRHVTSTRSIIFKRNSLILLSQSRLGTSRISVARYCPMLRRPRMGRILIFDPYRTRLTLYVIFGYRYVTCKRSIIFKPNSLILLSRSRLVTSRKSVAQYSPMLRRRRGGRIFLNI